MLLKIGVSSICLKGERTISTLKVRIPNLEDPSLEEKKKKIDTERMERNRPVHPGGSNSFNRFQVAGSLAGYL